MEIVYLPSIHGLGDQLNGFTTAVWLSEQLARPLVTCFEHAWIMTPRLSHAECDKLSQKMNEKPTSQFLLEDNQSVFVGCDKCEQIIPRLFTISRDVYRRYFQNVSFMGRLRRAQRVVLRYNRNVVSFTHRFDNRRILQSAIAPPPPIYDMCVHYRVLRTRQSMEAVVACSQHDPVMLFSNIGSAHLMKDLHHYRSKLRSKFVKHIYDAPQVYTHDLRSFLEMTRCRRFFIPTSAFSMAAALTSNASYDDILIYNDFNCTHNAPILKVRSMFFPH
jgi:hypothetical protein